MTLPEMEIQYGYSITIIIIIDVLIDNFDFQLMSHEWIPELVCDVNYSGSPMLSTLVLFYNKRCII